MKQAMWASLAHGKRTVQAHSGYFPPTYALLKWRLFHFPSDDSVDFLGRFGVDTAIVHPAPTVGLPNGPDRIRAGTWLDPFRRVMSP